MFWPSTTGAKHLIKIGQTCTHLTLRKHIESQKWVELCIYELGLCASTRTLIHWYVWLYICMYVYVYMHIYIYVHNDAVLFSSGSCLDVTGELRLKNKGIQSLTPGVFDNLRDVTWVCLFSPTCICMRLLCLHLLCDYQPSLITIQRWMHESTHALVNVSVHVQALPRVYVCQVRDALTLCSDCVHRKLYLQSNALSALPPGIFDKLTLLTLVFPPCTCTWISHPVDNTHVHVSQYQKY